MEIMLCWKRLFTTHAWHGYSFGRSQGNRDQYCELFLCETLVRELNFKKSTDLKLGHFPWFVRCSRYFAAVIVWFLPLLFCGSACSLYLNVFLLFYFFFVVRMSSVCLADVQDFWILLWINIYKYKYINVQTLISLNIDIASGNVWDKVICRLLL